MKFFGPKEAAPAIDPSSARLDRRGLLVGAGVTGAAALAVAALYRPGVTASPAAAARTAHDAGDGYRETQHVLRYYETARA